MINHRTATGDSIQVEGCSSLSVVERSSFSFLMVVSTNTVLLEVLFFNIRNVTSILNEASSCIKFCEKFSFNNVKIDY